MIKYRTGGYQKEIEKVEVEKESEKSVWINGRSHLKRSSCKNYFDTFEQAKKHLVTNGQKHITLCEGRLEYAQEKQAELLAKLEVEEKENEN